MAFLGLFDLLHMLLLVFTLVLVVKAKWVCIHLKGLYADDVDVVGVENPFFYMRLQELRSKAQATLTSFDGKGATQYSMSYLYNVIQVQSLACLFSYLVSSSLLL